DAVGARVPQRRHWPELSQYREPLDAELRRLTTTTTGSVTVRRARADVLRWCRDAATQTRGTFSLTVPTGGGKTLASLAFALDHALAHGLARIIVVLPFLSIIDQTAEVFRRIFGPSFGDRVLIEHHSSVRPEHDTMCNRLAAENWDAPLIVTTQVQFFESLFARRTTDCRKLHNIANSVVILDEVQTLPIGLLDPILDALQQLSTSYGTSLVLTTATQPSLHTRPLEPYPFAGLQPQPREIVPSAEIDRLFDRLRRVRVIWPQRGDDGAPAPIAWPELAARIAAHPQVLAIVHKRDDARALWREVTDRAPGALHLSALMCAAHRRAVLAEIGRRLDAAESCRVVSTQLVEAGVDVDFPVVYRAMAGLESLAQSAGRCNRNGALPSGDFHIFDAPTEPPRSLLAHRAIANVMLANARDEGSDLDLFSPHVHRAYFDRLYAAKDRDAANVQQSRQQLNFEETARRFRMIPDETTPVFVPWGANGRRALDRFRESPPNRETLRHLQPYSVSVHEGDLRALQSRGAVELVHDMLWVLVLDSDYDETFGLDVKGEAFRGWMV
ncbi:MAG TPA: DEAD/DEAH box helicase, partial [Thermoanaerobaculia bacterium]|nr:DEAD/DEAH box helicase [Thermoanaerobaculia bacterium]